ncbi:MAG: AI-2E family transporter [Candidatus Sungbacteria bacterium]|uniref:AI-2E family transporter n=1 Tax=Candidatus Sungiibacteriota bacterium TaxID=2750080 RepID=A0A932YW09_9BACT|nr:AI-2E family transporter [Candidatus Sungbacteria bacterium]
MANLRLISLDITYRSLFRIVAIGLLVAALFYLRQIVAALLFAIVIASGIEPGVKWFERLRVPRILAVLIIYVVAIAVLSGAIWLVLPALADEFSAFLDAFPRYQRILLSELRSFRDLPFFSVLSEGAESVILNPPFDLRSAGSSALDILVSVFGGVFSVVILVVVSFYLASQEDGIEHFLRMVTPLREEEYVIDLWSRSRAKIGQWLRGQALLGVVVGILVFIALTLLGIRYALFLALLAAVFELIPVIGPILAAVPAVFFAFISSPVLGLVVAVVYTIIQQLESHVLVPLLMRRVIGLNPLVVVVALLIGAKLGGILGMFLAVPLAAVAVEIMADVDRRKRGLFQFGQSEAR